MQSGIEAVAFDLDGTLYPIYRLFARLIPCILRQWPLMLAFGRARDFIRAEQERDTALLHPDFYEYQARLTAGILGVQAEQTKEKTEWLIYRGWEPLFKRIKLFPHAAETLAAFRGAGLKLGLLSDFPPERKLEYLGLDGYWDTMICSEQVNRLKPDPAPFLELSQRMALPPEQILYVGNSVPYDIIGAKRQGMKAALVVSALGKHRLHTGNADFVFSDYRQLREFVLG